MCRGVLRHSKTCTFGHSNCQILHGRILVAFGLRTRGVTPFGIAHANRSSGTLQFVCSSLVWMGRDSLSIWIRFAQCFATQRYLHFIVAHDFVTCMVRITANHVFWAGEPNKCGQTPQVKQLIFVGNVFHDIWCELMLHFRWSGSAVQTAISSFGSPVVHAKTSRHWGTSSINTISFSFISFAVDRKKIFFVERGSFMRARALAKASMLSSNFAFDKFHGPPRREYMRNIALPIGLDHRCVICWWQKSCQDKLWNSLSSPISVLVPKRQFFVATDTVSTFVDDLFCKVTAERFQKQLFRDTAKLVFDPGSTPEDITRCLRDVFERFRAFAKQEANVCNPWIPLHVSSRLN